MCLISRLLRLRHGDACAVERAADALHCRWIDAEPLGNDPYARPPRSRQSTNSLHFSAARYESAPEPHQNRTATLGWRRRPVTQVTIVRPFHRGPGDGLVV